MQGQSKGKWQKAVLSGKKEPKNFYEYGLSLTGKAAAKRFITPS
jgi:hypothetical protein